jgi:hypothetical protein
LLRQVAHREKDFATHYELAFRRTALAKSNIRSSIDEILAAIKSKLRSLSDEEGGMLLQEIDFELVWLLRQRRDCVELANRVAEGTNQCCSPERSSGHP